MGEFNKKETGRHEADIMPVSVKMLTAETKELPGVDLIANKVIAAIGLGSLLYDQAGMTSSPEGGVRGEEKGGRTCMRCYQTRRCLLPRTKKNRMIKKNKKG